MWDNVGDGTLTLVTKARLLCIQETVQKGQPPAQPNLAHIQSQIYHRLGGQSRSEDMAVLRGFLPYSEHQRVVSNQYFTRKAVGVPQGSGKTFKTLIPFMSVTGLRTGLSFISTYK